MNKEVKVSPVSQYQPIEEAVPKSVYERLLEKYERVLVHFGQVKERNRYLLESKSDREFLEQKVKTHENSIAKHQQSIAELEMYIKVLEERRAKDKDRISELSLINKEKEVDKIFENLHNEEQQLSTNELEALSEVFDIDKGTE